MENDAVASLAAGVLEIAVPLAAVGTISMALLELLKSVFRARAIFIRRRLLLWAGDEAGLHVLVRAACGEAMPDYTFYMQNSEDLFAQIQAGAAAAIEFPDEYPSFYAALTANVAADAAFWRDHQREVRTVPSRDDEDRAERLEQARLAVEARQRVIHYVTRRLENLQTRTSLRWARVNQLASVVLGAVLLWFVSESLLIEWSKHFGTVRLPQLGLPDAVQQYLTRGLISVLGGLVAPFSKDVVNALTGLRTRRVSAPPAEPV